MGLGPYCWFPRIVTINIYSALDPAKLLDYFLWSDESNINQIHWNCFYHSTKNSLVALLQVLSDNKATVYWGLTARTPRRPDRRNEDNHTTRHLSHVSVHWVQYVPGISSSPRAKFLRLCTLRFRAQLKIRFTGSSAARTAFDYLTLDQEFDWLVDNAWGNTQSAVQNLSICFSVALGLVAHSVCGIVIDRISPVSPVIQLKRLCFHHSCNPPIYTRIR